MENNMRYMIIIRSPEGPISATNIQWVIKELEKMIKNKPKLLFNSKAADFMGIQIETDKNPRQIVAKIGETFNFTTGGFVMAIEIGDGFASMGNSAGFRHLQH
jgi:hypothetical protein